MDNSKEPAPQQQITPVKQPAHQSQAHSSTPTPLFPAFPVYAPHVQIPAATPTHLHVPRVPGLPIYTAIDPYGRQFTMPVQQHPQIPQPMLSLPSGAVLQTSGPPTHIGTPHQQQPGSLREHDHFYTNSSGQRTSPRKKDKKDASGAQASVAQVDVETEFPSLDLLPETADAVKTPQKVLGVKQGARPAQGRARGGGRGSRSGANARKGGGSDEEIKALPEQAKKDAELVLPKKRISWDQDMTIKLVEFLVAPERWEKITLNLRPYCTMISQETFNGTVTSDQVYDRWTNVFRLYKDTKRWHVKHTGGGDGDAPTEGPELVTDYENEALAVAESNDTKAGGTHTTPPGGARRYSSVAMSKFAQSKIYELIDKVASGRADVERATEFSSHRTTEDIDSDLKGDASNEKTEKGKKRKNRDDSELDDLLEGAVKMISKRQSGDASRDYDRLALESDRLKLDKERAQKAEEYEAERLTIERGRNKREEAALEQRLRIERERYEREVEELHQKRERAAKDESMKKLELYNKLSKSDNRLEQALARKMEMELVEQLDLKDYM